MRRHDLDWASLVAGLVFLGVAAGYLLAATIDVTITPGWLLPVTLIGLGVAGLAASLTRAAPAPAACRELASAPLPEGDGRRPCVSPCRPTGPRLVARLSTRTPNRYVNVWPRITATDEQSDRGGAERELAGSGLAHLDVVAGPPGVPDEEPDRDRNVQCRCAQRDPPRPGPARNPQQVEHTEHGSHPRRSGRHRSATTRRRRATAGRPAGSR